MRLLALYIGLPILLQVGCTAQPKAEACREFVRVLHDFYNDEDFETIERLTDRDFADFLRTTFESRGKLRSSNLTGQNIERTLGSSDGFIELQYLTEFTSGAAMEYFVFEYRGNTMQLRDYNLQTYEESLPPDS